MDDNKKHNSGLKGFCLGVVCTLVVLGAMVVVVNWTTLIQGEMSPTSFGAKKKIAEISHHVEKYYLEELDEESLTDYMCAGMVAGLGDPYARYYTEEQYQEMLADAKGIYTGLGIVIGKQEDGKIVIMSCNPDTPAEEAGILEGDYLLRIDETDVSETTVSEVADMIQEKKVGEAFTMVLEREGTPYTVELATQEVEIVSVSGKMLEGQVGYLQIVEFTEVTAQQFAEVYQKLQEEGVEKLIIDLRDNPGGLVSGVCDTMRQILPEGLIVYTEDKDGKRKEYTCEGETPIEIPLVVLVNENSASASEIFAGAVQDYEIGTIVGTTTYGKGVVQNTIPLSDGSAVKLTISHYYTPKGNNIHGKGITPDVVCEMPEDAGTDVQLKKAIDVLNSK